MSVKRLWPSISAPLARQKLRALVEAVLPFPARAGIVSGQKRWRHTFYY